MRIKVYSILTLGPEEVRRVLPDAVVAAPIQQGDLLKDIQGGFNVVVIIDGRFYQSVAVSPTEIMDALRRGLQSMARPAWARCGRPSWNSME